MVCESLLFVTINQSINLFIKPVRGIEVTLSILTRGGS